MKRRIPLEKYQFHFKPNVAFLRFFRHFEINNNNNNNKIIAKVILQQFLILVRCRFFIAYHLKVNRINCNKRTSHKFIRKNICWNTRWKQGMVKFKQGWTPILFLKLIKVISYAHRWGKRVDEGQRSGPGAKPTIL